MPKMRLLATRRRMRAISNTTERNQLAAVARTPVSRVSKDDTRAEAIALGYPPRRAADLHSRYRFSAMFVAYLMAAR